MLNSTMRGCRYYILWLFCVSQRPNTQCDIAPWVLKVLKHASNSSCIRYMLPDLRIQLILVYNTGIHRTICKYKVHRGIDMFNLFSSSQLQRKVTWHLDSLLRSWICWCPIYALCKKTTARYLLEAPKHHRNPHFPLEPCGPFLPHLPQGHIRTARVWDILTGCAGNHIKTCRFSQNGRASTFW